MAKNWRTIASWILRFTKIGQKRSDILGKCAAYSSDSTVSTNPFWLVSQFYRSILLVFFITMAVLWLFCPEIRRVCIFSSPLDGRCHSQLKLEFQGFPGVEWWAPFQFLLSSVLLLLWHYKAMRAFPLLSTIAIGTKKFLHFCCSGSKVNHWPSKYHRHHKVVSINKSSLETRIVYKHSQNDNASVPTSQNHCIVHQSQKPLCTWRRLG